VPNFSQRDATPELMDVEECGFEDFRACLAQLAQVNGLTLAYRPTLVFLNRLLRSGRISPARRLTIIDAGCGYGDMLRKIDAWAARRGIEAELVGLDVNPWSARAAAEATDAARPIRWVTTDLFAYRAEGRADIVISSLFTHHLPNEAVIRFLRWMEATAAIGWFVNDLERHWLPYHAIKFAFRMTRRHRFMQHDGPVSIASAFTSQDWRDLTHAAGVSSASLRIEKYIPFRLCVSRVKAAS
jgi:SAM-dependent methyltransferase